MGWNIVRDGEGIKKGLRRDEEGIRTGIGKGVRHGLEGIKNGLGRD